MWEETVLTLDSQCANTCDVDGFMLLLYDLTEDEAEPAGASLFSIN